MSPVHSRMLPPPPPPPRLPLRPTIVLRRACPRCLKVVPITIPQYDYGRNMCRSCALEVAEEEGHRRARETLRIRIPNRPPTPGQDCELCREWFPLTTLRTSGNEMP